jgi:RecG-like helicase
MTSEATAQKGQEVKLYGCKIIKITGTQQSITKNSKYRKIPFSVTAQDSSLKEICLNFFQINESYKAKFKIGAMLNICGKIEIYKDKRTISHPKIEFINNSFHQKVNSQQSASLNSGEMNNLQNTIAKIIFPRENLNEEDEGEGQSNLFDKDKKIHNNQIKKTKINPQNVISIESFYPLTEGLTHFFIKKIIKKIFSEIKKK